MPGLLSINQLSRQQCSFSQRLWTLTGRTEKEKKGQKILEYFQSLYHQSSVTNWPVIFFNQLKLISDWFELVEAELWPVYTDLSSVLTCWAWTESLSGENGRSATSHHGGATPWSPLIGRCEASRWCRCTASLWCRRCRQPRHRPGGCEGSGWWCGPVYCSSTTLRTDEWDARKLGQRVHVKNQMGKHAVVKCGQLTVFKIKAVEVEAFNQIPQSLRLKCRHSRVTHFTDRIQRLSK